MPLPSVKDSCARFLEWCGPLLDAAELATTREAVAAFESDATARELQAALCAYEASDGTWSWLDEFWRDRYLGRRDRIALNANFFFLFNNAPPPGRAPGDSSQIARAAALVAAALEYKRALDTETLPPVTRRGTPLSMDQHRYLFSTTRIPGLTRDGVRAPYGASLPPVPGNRPAGWAGASDARHIVVFARGAMYAVDVLGADGVAYTRDELARALCEVTRAGAARGRGQSVGSLTTMARGDWARSRAALLAAAPGNEATLDVVETALLCLALEDEPPAGEVDACKRLLAGDPGNRWFDKGVTFIVFPDGSAGFNGEHCLLDGTTIVEFIDAVLTRPAEPDADRAENDRRGAPSWRPVEFTITADLVSAISTAAAEFIQYGQDTATLTVSLADFGSDRAKALGISPDAFAQLAFQLAHRRSKGFNGATYESIATRHLRHGRTEAMRVVTPEILDFTAAMDDPAAGRDARRAALRQAARAHVARAAECQAGDAPEQHLWELQMAARRQGRDWSPALYRSPGWTRMRDDNLSTSAAPSVNIQYFGFGATSKHCIGAAYVLLPGRLNLHLSTPRSVGAQMAVFAGRLREAVTEMSDLLGAG